MGNDALVSPEQQYAALTTGAGCVALGHRTQIELTGGDRVVVLNNLCTNDVARLGAGEGCEAFVTSLQGKILGHVLVFCGDDSLVVESVPGQGRRLVEHFDKYIIREDVALHDRSPSWCELLLSGPLAVSVWNSIGTTPAPDPMYGHVSADVAGGRVSVRRVPISTSPALLISGPADFVDTLGDALQAAGATPCRGDVFEQVRIEDGWPEFGRDITDQNLPQEVGRDAQAIGFRKGCYLGQETVARIDALGHVNRKLAGLRFAAKTVPADGTQLVLAGKTVGRITSAAWSPRLAAVLAMGYVRREYTAIGTQLESTAGTAEVVHLPLVHGA